MRRERLSMLLIALSLGLAAPSIASADINVQCPGDLNGDAVPDPPNPDYDPNVRCAHIAAGDGFVKMADGEAAYIFGFSNVTGVPPAQVPFTAELGATFPAPTIAVDEGNEVYLTLTNVGLRVRPDLFDAHTVHWHGFPNAAAIFDGVPESSVAPNMGSSLTYYYKPMEPGTYMYHCHFEALEHMQMGMLGNLYVRPRQNRLPDGTSLNGFIHHTGYKYVYNDGDGSTYYDVEFPVQMSGFDIAFHSASENVQPLPFSEMKDDYPMLNGRGFPDTINPNPLTPPVENGSKPSQDLGTLIQARTGQKVLLRISNLGVTRPYTLSTLGVPMTVVGKDSRLLRSSGGENLFYKANSVTLGGGESMDVILDTSGIAPGIYALYTANLNYLSNNKEDFGGMMTGIIIRP